MANEEVNQRGGVLGGAVAKSMSYVGDEDKGGRGNFAVCLHIV